MFKTSSNLWFGSEESYFAFLDAQEQLSKLEASGTEAVKMAIQARGGGKGDDPFALPPMWERQGSLAVLNIGGSLINGTAGFMRLFGVVGYGDITQALVEIAGDKDVKSVLMNIDSGGGQVDGVEDAGDSIRALDAIKPVVAYTGGTMGSAAYWLGASARAIGAAKTAQVGSVGTLIMHVERSKMLKEAGITPTIVRFGKYKALANPVEPLSKEGEAELQGMADEAGSIFVEYVADRRGMTPEAFQKKAGEGRVFMGRQALAVGLVDSVSNLSGAVAGAKGLDKASAQQHNARNFGKGPHMFTLKTLLAIIKGVALDALGLAAPEANLQGVKLEGDALVAAETEAKTLIAAMTERIDAAVAAATEKLTADMGVLSAANAELQVKLTAAEAAAKTAEAAKATFEAASNDFQVKLGISTDFGAKAAEIVKASMATMSVALGGSADVGATLVGPELLAQHDALAATFKAKFPNARVSGAGMDTKSDPSAGKGAPPMFASLVKPAAK